MAEPPKPTAKVNPDPHFEDRLRDLKTHAQQEFKARQQGNRVEWFRPLNFNGDLDDVDNLGDSFTRDQANREAVDAVKNPQAPGVSGDTVAAVTMVETLACMERAFRMRHSLRRVRGTAHAIGRLKGHGDDTGPLIQNGIEYLRQVMAQARKPQS